MHESLYWLLARYEGRAIGIGLFVPRSGCTLETHISFLPEAWGPIAFESFRRMREWIRTQTQFARLIGEIPRSNRLSIHFARRSGARQYAVNQRSILRNGKREDQICFAIELEEMTL